MHPSRIPAPVLVVLDLHQQRLGAADEPRDPPRVRVGLLQVVRRPVDQQLTDLRERRVSLDEGCERSSVERPASAWRASRTSPAANGCVTVDLTTETAFERSLQFLAQLEHPRIPLAFVGHPGESAVVLLVGEVQREVEVVVADRIDRRRGPPRSAPPAECSQHRVADRTARTRQGQRLGQRAIGPDRSGQRSHIGEIPPAETLYSLAPASEEEPIPASSSRRSIRFTASSRRSVPSFDSALP